MRPKGGGHGPPCPPPGDAHGKDIGTFGQCFEFADVSKNSSAQVLEFSESAPEWRVAYPGLSLEGPCKNSQCAAYQKSFVICNFQLKQEGFEMCEVAATCWCPLCKSKIEPVTMGFNNCKYRVRSMSRQ